VYSVFAVENPLVDVIAHVEQPLIQRLGKRPGAMHLIEETESAALLAQLPDCRSLPGGSAANTVRGVAWLSRALGGRHRTPGGIPRPVFNGAVGRDALGDFYADALERAGVDAALVRVEARTGTSVILVTPDGERTMNTHLGACRLFTPEHLDTARLQQSQVLYLTGYLWDTPNQRETAERATAAARARGILVAFDLADPWAVERYAEQFRAFIPGSVDLLFANREELALLTGVGCDEDCMSASRALAPRVVMKVGAGGCWIGGSAEAPLHVPGERATLVDTTGAGDAFAAGWLTGLLAGKPAAACARLANRLAAGIVGVEGCDYERLEPYDPPG
jgi:sugar/nucleoside kinase (ribokinase family)